MDYEDSLRANANLDLGALDRLSAATSIPVSTSNNNPLQDLLDRVSTQSEMVIQEQEASKSWQQVGTTARQTGVYYIALLGMCAIVGLLMYWWYTDNALFQDITEHMWAFVISVTMLAFGVLLSRYNVTMGIAVFMFGVGVAAVTLLYSLLYQ